MKKVALVTGSTQGIGRAIADKLVADGLTVIYSGSRAQFDGEEYFSCDISKEKDRKAILDYIDRKFGRLDLLVNNAGVACKERLDILETTEESFDRLISINTKGTFFMCQLFAKYMIDLKNKNLEDYSPKIINISSISSYTSSVSRGEYCISKAGISMVTKLFADKLGDYDIPVFEIRPGIIKTPMTECVIEKYDKLIENGLTPIKRWGKPEDVGNCVSALATGLMDFCTGTVFNVDGGFSVRKL